MDTTSTLSARETLTIEEVADRLGIGRSLAYKLARNGKLPALRLGRRYVIPRERFEAFVRGDA